jgi:hypothetical protein
VTVGTATKIKSLPSRTPARIIKATLNGNITPVYFLEWSNKVVPVGYKTILEVSRVWQALELNSQGWTQPEIGSNYATDLALFYNRAATASVVEGVFTPGRGWTTHD